VNQGQNEEWRVKQHSVKKWSPGGNYCAFESGIGRWEGDIVSQLNIDLLVRNRIFSRQPLLEGVVEEETYDVLGRKRDLFSRDPSPMLDFGKDRT